MIKAGVEAAGGARASTSSRQAGSQAQRTPASWGDGKGH